MVIEKYAANPCPKNQRKCPLSSLQVVQQRSCPCFHRFMAPKSIDTRFMKLKHMQNRTFLQKKHKKWWNLENTMKITSNFETITFTIPFWGGVCFREWTLHGPLPPVFRSGVNKHGLWFVQANHPRKGQMLRANHHKQPYVDTSGSMNETSWPKDMGIPSGARLQTQLQRNHTLRRSKIVKASEGLEAGNCGYPISE